MQNIIYTLTVTPDDSFLTAFLPGEDPLGPVGRSHPNFNAIVGACEGSHKGEDIDPEDFSDLFDIAKAITRTFTRLGKRVTVEGDVVYFDGDPVESFLTDQILRFLDAGEAVEPLVNFWEKCENNPNDHSREQLYGWLSAHQFTITPEGDIVGYKGVRAGDNGVYTSIHQGPARVNGEAVNGYVPNSPGDVVEMPRSEVKHDPGVSCSVGLHVATYNYASTWSSGIDAVMEVHVDPRDVVSVPTDSSGEKVRACRYTVIGPVDAAYDGPIVPRDDRPATVGIDLIFPEEGDRVADFEGDQGTVEPDGSGGLQVRYDDTRNGVLPIEKDDYNVDPDTRFFTRIHGKGGATSVQARGNGRNAAQDAKGKFSQGRPGSARDSKTGRFS